MGHTASKEVKRDVKLVQRGSKESQYDTNTLPSYDAEEETIEDESTLTPSQNKAPHNIATPRITHGRHNGAINVMPNGDAFTNGHKHRTQMVPPQSRDDVAPTKFIADEEVQVNLAMADLMAYLQVVANNSNNLPLTRRDDPEIGRMVSTLTADEYARKSAAFIPADVRVIGGSFTKYGRVWDLPTSEEYTASDGAQEPGRSYGGACCNAMLKVLYDAANDGHEGVRAACSQSLFDDDDDESLAKPIEFERHATYSSLILADCSSMPKISWASLLRKMKVEMKDIDYAQAPTITSTQKFDLNKPFSFLPDTFDPMKGKKRSLLIGCNYSNMAGTELKASHDDIRSMKDYIVNVHGFPETKGLMTVLLDDDEHVHPTHQNITEAFKALSEQSQPGDAVFVHFSGHGGRILDSSVHSEAESYDEVIVPCDYSGSGLIRDTLIFKTLLAPMRYGVTMTILIDCCDTGMVLDLPYAWNTKNDKTEAPAKMTMNDDFSFVRFLKVVKTLYESSTFTQLGKTVGVALNQPAPRDSREIDDEDTLGVASNGTHEDDNIAKSNPSKGSLLNVLTSCTSPQHSPVPMKGIENKTKQSKAVQDGGTVATRENRGPQTLLEQVMNCTLVHGDDDSEDDMTYNSRTVDDHSEDGDTLDNSTFDSLNDDSYSARDRGRVMNRRR